MATRVDRSRVANPGRPLKRLLLIDDDPDTRRLVAAVLEGAGGYTVKACASIAHAYEAARSFPSDLILLDVMTSGPDGVSALNGLRRIGATRETPVVFMTATARPEGLDRYDELGCLGVIAKPLDPSTLADTLEDLWRRNDSAVGNLFDGELAALRRAFMGELPGRISAMRKTAEALASGGWDRELVKALHHDTHRLAGSSGLYQMLELSRSAGVLEEIVTLLLNAPAWPPASSPVELTTLVKAVGRAARTEARLAQPPRARPAARFNAARALRGSTYAKLTMPSGRLRRTSRSDT
jgi:two-component system, OmpR family, response regulator